MDRQSSETLPKEKATVKKEGEAGCGEQPKDCATDSLSLEFGYRGNGSAEVTENRVQKNRKRCEFQLPLYILPPLVICICSAASNDTTTLTHICFRLQL